MSPGFLLIVVLLFGLAWLFMIRPQKRRRLDQARMLDSLAPGDEILTAGGLYATVRSVDEDDVVVELGPGTSARLAKRAVAAVLTQDDRPEELVAGREDHASEPVARDSGDGAPG